MPCDFGRTECSEAFKLTCVFKRCKIYIMVRIQVQLRNELYQQARCLVEQKEISLAEIVRRGVERLLIIYPADRSSGWKLAPPANTRLRKNPFGRSDWRGQANVRTIFRAGGKKDE